MDSSSEICGPCRLVLDGDLTVRAIEHAYGLVSGALAENDAVELDCSGAAAMDVSFVQLLLAARGRAVSAGKSFALKHPTPEILHSVLARGGFLPDGGEGAAANRSFWLGAE